MLQGSGGLSLKHWGNGLGILPFHLKVWASLLLFQRRSIIRQKRVLLFFITAWFFCSLALILPERYVTEEWFSGTLGHSVPSDYAIPKKDLPENETVDTRAVPR